MVVGLGRCSWGCNDNFGWVVPIIEEDDNAVEAPVVVALGVVLVVVVVVVDVMGGLGNVVVTDVGDEVVRNGSCNFLGDVAAVRVVVRVACGFVGVVVVI